MMLNSRRLLSSAVAEEFVIIREVQTVGFREGAVGEPVEQGTCRGTHDARLGKVDVGIDEAGCEDAVTDILVAQSTVPLGDPHDALFFDFDQGISQESDLVGTDWIEDSGADSHEQHS